MSSIVITGNTSGSITLDAPAIAGSTTLTLAPASGTLGPLIAGTSQATTSGTAIDFTDIPSWVKRITLVLSGVSTSGTSQLLVQVGDSGGIETTGYDSCASIGGTGVVTAFSSAGYIFEAGGGGGAVTIRHGAVTLYNLSGNIWVSSHAASFGTVGQAFIAGGGTKTLSATLDRLRLTTVNGTDTFDAGSVNILYE